MQTNRGFLTFAQNSIRNIYSEETNDKEYVDYLRHAYALALSIKISQKENKFAVVVTPGQQIPEKYRKVFDYIIEVPWGDLSEPHEQKFFNEWKAVHVTPFENTIKIESDMLLTESIDYWWEYLEGYNLAFTHKVYDYRECEIISRACRKHFDSNSLPNVYNGLMFFKKNNEISNQFFSMAEAIMKDWKGFSYKFLDYKRPEFMDTDTAYALAVQLTNLDNECLLDLPFPTFVHMKTELQNWRMEFKSQKWIDNVSVILNSDNELKIGNYKQTLPFHYQEKDFLTDEIISKLEDNYGRI